MFTTVSPSDLRSTLETTFDGGVTTDVSGRGILSLTSSRPSLTSWRLGQSSPRLQAGDAPSMANSYGGGRGGGGQQGARYLYPGHLRRQLTGRGATLSSGGGGGGPAGDRGAGAGDELQLDGLPLEVTGYMSDGDVLSKNIARADDVSSG